MTAIGMNTIFIFAISLPLYQSYMLYLDAKAEECFYEVLEPNQKAG